MFQSGKKTNTYSARNVEKYSLLDCLTLLGHTTEELGGKEASKTLKGEEYSRRKAFGTCRHRIKFLSKTSLKALARGLKVVRWDREVLWGLPDKHSPDKVGTRTIEIYQGNLSERRLYY